MWLLAHPHSELFLKFPTRFRCMLLHAQHPPRLMMPLKCFLRWTNHRLKEAHQAGPHRTVDDQKGTKLKCRQVITCLLECPNCSPHRALLIEDCTMQCLENHFVHTESWWTNTFVCDFAILIHHHFHTICGLSQVCIHWESPGDSRKGSRPIPAEKTWLISVMASKNHFAVLCVDLQKKAIKIIDGYLADDGNHQIDWSKVVEHIFQTTGLVFAERTTQDVHMCCQANTNDCGPVTCTVVWDLLSKLMPIPKGTFEERSNSWWDNDTVTGKTSMKKELKASRCFSWFFPLVMSVPKN